MNNYKNKEISEIIKSWSDNSNYPIDHPQKIIDTFADALTEIHAVPEIQNKTATNEEYITIYNKIMLNPIFDSHPIGFIWHEDSQEFLEDIASATSMADNIFETVETKNAYLISLAVAFKKSAPKALKDTDFEQASLIIYEKIFSIENPNFSYTDLSKNITDDYSHLDDGQALAFQIQYHRWMILNKNILPETSYMRNRFINIVIRKNFPKHTPNPESKTETSYSESHQKLKLEIMGHMTKGLEDKKSEELNKWVASFVNNVMLVYYGFYKWDKLRGDFYQVIDLEKSQFGIKLPDQYEDNLEEFSKYIKIKDN
ncbi:hypothetical protein N9T31_00415 [Alphaproteobacteria bacterium]|nr:hypothetical protein [Alphaproteobacteria bacterium]